jgi:hypothetical protein
MSEAQALSWRREMFAEYVAARRSVRFPGYTLEAADEITRYLPQAGNDESILCLARFGRDSADRRIGEELDRVARHG